jgi:hypothetical protein
LLYLHAQVCFSLPYICFCMRRRVLFCFALLFVLWDRVSLCRLG